MKNEELISKSKLLTQLRQWQQENDEQRAAYGETLYDQGYSDAVDFFVTLVETEMPVWAAERRQ